MKNKYVKPRTAVLPIAVQLMSNWSMNNASPNGLSTTSERKGYIRFDNDVLSREGRDDYWDDYDEE